MSVQEDSIMFDSLDEQMKSSDSASSTPRERWIRYASMAVVSVLVFGALYAAIMLME
jgi:hypothetical protein